MQGARDGAASEDAAAGGGYAMWSAMARETEALQRQLAALAEDPRHKVAQAADMCSHEGISVRVSLRYPVSAHSRLRGTLDCIRLPLSRIRSGGPK